MAYQVVDVGGRKFRAIIPDWAIRNGGTSANAGLASGSEIDVGALQGQPHAKPKSRVEKLILNEKGNYKIVPEETAKMLTNPRNMRAIEIEETDPDYVKAWELAHGYTDGKSRNIQVRGEALSGDDIGTVSFDREHKKVMDKVKKIGSVEIPNDAPEEKLESVSRVSERAEKRAAKVKGGK